MRKKTLCTGLGLVAAVGVADIENTRAMEVAPGLSASADFVQDYFRAVSGGARYGGGAPSALHLSSTLTSRYWGGSGVDRFHLDLLAVGGSSISKQVGDIQGLDNVEASETWRLFAAWYEHQFSSTGTGVRLGIQDFNTLFNTLDTASVFINSSAGLDPSISQVGISTFPEPDLGAVYQWYNRSGLYALAGIYANTPGPTGHSHGTHIEWGKGDRAFYALETGISATGDNGYKAGLGIWYDTKDFQDPQGLNRDTNQGAYLIGEHSFAADQTGLPWKTGVYVQAGFANESRNTIGHYLGVGATITGLLPSRPDDQLGLAVASARTSSAYRSANQDAATAETAFELTYQSVVTPYLLVQPDIQYIVNPGALRSVDNAWVVGVRAEISW